MADPTNPYRDNPAHREIADLQRRLQGVIEDADDLRDARDEARRKVDRLKRDLRYAERRHTSEVRRVVTAGVAAAALCVVIGHKMRAAPADDGVQTVGMVILASLGFIATVALMAVWSDP